MKKSKILFLSMLFLGLIFPNTSLPLVLYDDFSGTYINKDKWIYGEFVREIREITPGDRRLVLKFASPHPEVIQTYPCIDNATMRFSDPNSVNSIQTDVTILENTVTGSAETGARLWGMWYNDGTVGGGYSGDIYAEVRIRWTITGFKGWWYVGKFTGPDISSLTTIGEGYFNTTININTTYVLAISYDGNNQFTFKVGAEEIAGPADLPPRIGNANIAVKHLQLREQVDNATSSCRITASFDNVLKNGILYDDFSSLTIDKNKWTLYEFVREISEGKFRSKVRSSSASDSTIFNRLEFLYPSSINTIQAKVTPLIYQNNQGTNAVARIFGHYYNDGTQGGGLIGDVGAEVYIGWDGIDPIAGWEVWTYSEFDGKIQQILESGTFRKPVLLNNTYTLFLSWDGNQFTFKIDDEEDYYKPVTNTNALSNVT